MDFLKIANFLKKSPNPLIRGERNGNKKITHPNLSKTSP